MAKRERKLVDHTVYIKQFGNGWTFEGHKEYNPYERETTKEFCKDRVELVKELVKYLDLGRLCLLPLEVKEHPNVA